MKKYIQVIVIGVVIRDGKVLLTQRNELNKEYKQYHAFWHFPGGGVEFGETLEECLAREMKEEVGHNIVNIRKIPTIYSDVRGNWHGILISFLCDFSDPNEKFVLDEETLSYAWYDLSEISSLKSLPWTQQIAEEAIRIAGK